MRTRITLFKIRHPGKLHCTFFSYIKASMHISIEGGKAISQLLNNKIPNFITCFSYYDILAKTHGRMEMARSHFPTKIRCWSCAHALLGIEKIFKENLVLVVILILEYKALY